MRFDEDCDDLFDIRVGPFGMGAFFGSRPFRVKYSRTSDSHLLRVRINKEARKEDIRERHVEPEIIELEWPRGTTGEEIPVE